VEEHQIEIDRLVADGPRPARQDDVEHAGLGRGVGELELAVAPDEHGALLGEHRGAEHVDELVARHLAHREGLRRAALEHAGRLAAAHAQLVGV
jgi:hypothetical protein